MFMSDRITAFEAKNRLGRLLDRVEAGEEIVITRHGRPVARLVAAPGGAEDARLALERLKQVRQTLENKQVKVSRSEVRKWAAQGRR